MDPRNSVPSLSLLLLLSFCFRFLPVFGFVFVHSTPCFPLSCFLSGHLLFPASPCLRSPLDNALNFVSPLAIHTLHPSLPSPGCLRFTK